MFKPTRWTRYFMVTTEWPWLRILKAHQILDVEAAEQVVHQPLWRELRGKEWVRMPDGRVGVIDHHKSDGRLAVRPVNIQKGAYFPNPSHHWSDEDRLKIPEEHAYSWGQLQVIEDPKDLPHPVRHVKKPH